ncbi:hypothetical protein [Streptomyces bacillaris]|uniref:hypothetical protein n=1 Tax=Streptomyces bacillaris TaxID=68179 RepID=UPI00363E378C
MDLYVGVANFAIYVVVTPAVWVSLLLVLALVAGAGVWSRTRPDSATGRVRTSSSWGVRTRPGWCPDTSAEPAVTRPDKALDMSAGVCPGRSGHGTGGER